ncbi:MAG: hypothetical protein U0871_04580 [Gemmataceae bacterium]
MTGPADTVRVALAGTDGNALALLGRWRRAARDQGWPEAAIDAVSDAAMAGDYQHLLATLAEHTDPGVIFGGEVERDPLDEGDGR